MGSVNKCERVCVAIPLAESPPVYLIQRLEPVFGIMCICYKWERVKFWVLEIDYTDTTTRDSMTTIDLGAWGPFVNDIDDQVLVDDLVGNVLLWAGGLCTKLGEHTLCRNTELLPGIPTSGLNFDAMFSYTCWCRFYGTTYCMCHKILQPSNSLPLAHGTHMVWQKWLLGWVKFHMTSWQKQDANECTLMFRNVVLVEPGDVGQETILCKKYMKGRTYGIKCGEVASVLYKWLMTVSCLYAHDRVVLAASHVASIWTARCLDNKIPILWRHEAVGSPATTVGICNRWML